MILIQVDAKCFRQSLEDVISSSDNFVKLPFIVLDLYHGGHTRYSWSLMISFILNLL